MKTSKKYMKNFWMIAALAVVLPLAGCGGDDEKVVTVSTISLGKTSVTLDPGGKETVNVTSILPENATNKTLVWSSADDDVATVNSGGLIEAIETGTTTVYCKSQDGGAEATVTVTVNDVDYADIVKGQYEGHINIRQKQVDYRPELLFELVYSKKNELTFENEFMLQTLALSDKPELAELIAGGMVPEEVKLKISGTMVVSSDDNGGYLAGGSGNLAFVPPYDEVAKMLLEGNTGTSFTIDNLNQEGTAVEVGEELPTIDADGKMHLRFRLLGLGEAHYDGQKK